MKDVYSVNWGRIRYKEALERQQHYFNQFLKAKEEGALYLNHWISCEHPPVITLGKHAKLSNLLYSECDLSDKGVEVVATERGGDVTFHGLGQLVVYPIIDLEEFGLGLREYISFLEEIVIRTLRDYGLHGERIDGAAGVWLGKNTANERKICAIGVKSSRYVTMHGLALNINTDLSYFSLINPCGFLNKGVTSLQKETGRFQNMNDVNETLIKHARELLDCDFFS